MGAVCFCVKHSVAVKVEAILQRKTFYMLSEGDRARKGMASELAVRLSLLVFIFTFPEPVDSGFADMREVSASAPVTLAHFPLLHTQRINRYIVYKLITLKITYNIIE
jgi:hypothetical protein